MRTCAFIIGIAAAAVVFVRPAESAWPIRQGGLRFSLTKIEAGPWGESQDGGENTQILALTLEIFNETYNRKFSLAEGYYYRLTDEFGNQYRYFQSAPEVYPEPVFIPSPNYPSLYPGNMLIRTLFFEIPVEQSRKFRLTLDAAPMGKEEKVEIPFVREELVVVNAPPKTRPAEEGDLKILNPKTGSEVTNGDTLHVEVSLSREVDPPDRIFVITDDYVFEDETGAYRYDVRVPGDRRAGRLTLVVMAHWGTEKSEIVVSDAIDLQVTSKGTE